MGYQYFELLNGVTKYSKAQQGDCFFTIDGRVTNFQVKEFACKDGSDEILIDCELVKKLQALRDRFGVTTINSAYRTPSWNSKVGGAKGSYHVQGKASDTVCVNASPLEVAMVAEAWGMGGIGLYSSFTHIDTRKGCARWDSSRGGQVGVLTFLKTIRLGASGQLVRILQKYLKIKESGLFDLTTLNRVKEFQKLHKLDVDGIVGKNTWTALLK